MSDCYSPSFLTRGDSKQQVSCCRVSSKECAETVDEKREKKRKMKLLHVHVHEIPRDAADVDVDGDGDEDDYHSLDD